MKKTKSLLYGLLLLTGLAGCSKEYNSDPGNNSNGFGGTNPVAPITGAPLGEMVFKENGRTVRVQNVIWLDDGTRRRISGVTLSADGTTTTGYSIEFRYFNSGQNELNTYYYGSGKLADSVLVQKVVAKTSNPTLESTVQYYSGALPVNLPGYASGRVTDTAKNIMKGEFAGRIVRRNFGNLEEDYPGDFLDITTGFFQAKKFEP